MTSSRRKSPSGFSLPEDETVETIEETTAEVMGGSVEEEAEEAEEEIVAEVKLPAAPVQAPVLNNPKPVVERTSPRRNTPRFSAQR
jgi:hypothetical protein